MVGRPLTKRDTHALAVLTTTTATTCTTNHNHRGYAAVRKRLGQLVQEGQAVAAPAPTTVQKRAERQLAYKEKKKQVGVFVVVWGVCGNGVVVGGWMCFVGRWVHHAILILRQRTINGTKR